MEEKQESNKKNYVQDNVQSQLIYTPRYLQEKHRLNREVEDFKLQMARKKKQVLESEAMHKNQSDPRRWDRYRIQRNEA